MRKPGNRPRRSRLRQWIEISLLAAGATGLGIWAWSIARSAVYQDWENWVFERASRGQPATIAKYLGEKEGRIAEDVRAWFGIPAAKREVERPSPGPPAQPPPFIETNGVVGRLAIPRLHIRAMVREGTGESTLDVALGHIPGTALPGQYGNVGIAGHRDTMFRGLREIQKNDLIRFETLAGTYVYQVEATQIVKPEDVQVLGAGPQPELTLVTCYPFYYVGSAPDRFVVKARQVALGATRRPSPAIAQDAAESAPPAHGRAKYRRGQTARMVGGLARQPTLGRVTFEVSMNHRRELVPGISLGLSSTDVPGSRMNGWMWVMPERRTIWLHDTSAHEPVIFYGRRDGRMRELVITNVNATSVAGYLWTPGPLTASLR